MLGKTLFVMICIRYYVPIFKAALNCTTTVLAALILTLTELTPAWVMVIAVSPLPPVFKLTQLVIVRLVLSRTRQVMGTADVVKVENDTIKYPLLGSVFYT